MAFYDVAVVGCGPAGTAAAHDLAKRGVRVVLVEREELPRYKTCGGGVVFRARSMLDPDITPVIERECFSASLSLMHSGISFRATRDHPIISMVMRSKLDRFLTEAARKAGAELMEGFCVESAGFQEDSVTLCSGSTRVRARHVIAADGANSLMARIAGWKETRKLAPALECELCVDNSVMRRFEGSARFDFDMPSNGYAWVFPKEAHLSVGLVACGCKGRTNLRASLHTYMQKLGLAPSADMATHGFVIPVSPRKDGFVRRRVFLVGDAAGLADPVSAEGISSSVHSGQCAARALLDAELAYERGRSLYEERLANSVLAELASGRRLAGLLYSSRQFRAWLMRDYGQRLTEAVVDVYMGKRTFRNFVETFMEKIGSL